MPKPKLGVSRAQFFDHYFRVHALDVKQAFLKGPNFDKVRYSISVCISPKPDWAAVVELWAPDVATFQAMQENVPKVRQERGLPGPDDVWEGLRDASARIGFTGPEVNAVGLRD